MARSTSGIPSGGRPLLPPGSCNRIRIAAGGSSGPCSGSLFPEGRRHDFEALAAYEAYGNALDRAESLVEVDEAGRVPMRRAEPRALVIAAPRS